MKIATYAKDHAGLIVFCGAAEWDSVEQWLTHNAMEAEWRDPPVVEHLAGWPDTSVTWVDHVGYAVRDMGARPEMYPVPHTLDGAL